MADLLFLNLNLLCYIQNNNNNDDDDDDDDVVVVVVLFVHFFDTAIRPGKQTNVNLL